MVSLDKKKLANELRLLRGNLKKIIFAEMLGVKYQSYLRYESGGRRVPPPVIRLARLLTGKLPVEPEIVIEAHPRIMATEDQTRLTETSEDYRPVALVEGKIAAGTGRIVQEDIESYILVRREDLGRRECLVGVQFGEKEKSMKPTFQPGCIVVIDKGDKTPGKKGIYAVRLGNDECAIKRICILKNTILLLSDNPAYAPMLAHTTDLDQLIVGRVIWSCRNLLK